MLDLSSIIPQPKTRFDPLAGACAAPLVPLDLRPKSSVTSNGDMALRRIQATFKKYPWAVPYVERSIPLLVCWNSAGSLVASGHRELQHHQETCYYLKRAMEHEVSDLTNAERRVAWMLIESCFNWCFTDLTVEGAVKGEARKVKWMVIMTYHLVGSLIENGLFAPLEDGTDRHEGIERLISEVYADEVETPMGKSARKAAPKLLSRLRKLGLYLGDRS